MHTLRQRWQTTWQQLHLPAPVHLFDDLMARYGEPQRRYHTPRHLDECFAALDLLRVQLVHAADVELALWFHDAVYDVRRDDNEAASCALAARMLAGTGVGTATLDHVRALIMTTRHHDPAGDPDALALSDADLAILGAAPARFLEYEGQIREEYGHVPGAAFARGRRRVLETFLGRPAVFATPAFAQSREAQARANLTDALGRLPVSPE